MNTEKIVAKCGLAGIFVVCFLSATLLPGVSEVGLAALAVAGVYKAWTLIITASLGNWLGSVFTYATGWLFGYERLLSLLGIEQESVENSIVWVQDYGSWAGLLVWVPVIGDPIAACLGVMHTPVFLTCLTMLVGKAVRYVIIVLPSVKVGHLYKEHKNKKQDKG